MGYYRLSPMRGWDRSVTSRTGRSGDSQHTPVLTTQGVSAPSEPLGPGPSPLAVVFIPLSPSPIPSPVDRHGCIAFAVAVVFVFVVIVVVVGSDSRGAVASAQVVCAPYTTLLCPRTRASSGLALQDRILILDEVLPPLCLRLRLCIQATLMTAS